MTTVDPSRVGAGRYEIINGVLTIRPPALFDGSFSLGGLNGAILEYFREPKREWYAEFNVPN